MESRKSFLMYTRLFFTLTLFCKSALQQDYCMSNKDCFSYGVRQKVDDPCCGFARNFDIISFFCTSKKNLYTSCLSDTETYRNYCED